MPRLEMLPHFSPQSLLTLAAVVVVGIVAAVIMQKLTQRKGIRNMLILSRKLNEVIHIGEGVFVKVLGIHGSVVKLGIEAPQDVNIRRAEIGEEPREGRAE